MLNDLQTYLANRGIEIGNRAKPMEITESEEDLARVAGSWTSNADEIRLVVQARCDKLREKLILTDMPFETPVTRQCLAELGGLLEDFENINAEHLTREKNKGGTKVTTSKAKPTEGT